MIKEILKKGATLLIHSSRYLNEALNLSFSGAAPDACGDSRAGGRVGAVAAGLHHSHWGSELLHL